LLTGYILSQFNDLIEPINYLIHGFIPVTLTFWIVQNVIDVKDQVKPRFY